jgi:23S rRNA (cytosine1962-C5)-methyltransferase
VNTLDYELLDSGAGQKWERFGERSVVRPDSMAIWSPAQDPATWQADAHCVRAAGGSYEWQTTFSKGDTWVVSYGPIQFELRLSQSKNIGVFPEQEDNWHWIDKVVRQSSAPLKILNLFAYTGGATLAATQAGAEVCHVDASKSTVNWASRNYKLSGLQDKPVRWIVDDALKFTKREIARGVRYDGVILDPPPFGHGAAGTFAFRKQAYELLMLCKQVLVPKPKLFVFNCYALNYTPQMAKALVGEVFGARSMECGELLVHEKKRPKALSCSVYVRFSER